MKQSDKNFSLTSSAMPGCVGDHGSVFCMVFHKLEEVCRCCDHKMAQIVNQLLPQSSMTTPSFYFFPVDTRCSNLSSWCVQNIWPVDTIFF